MCGIAGFIDYRTSDGEDAARHVIEAMCERLAHRGPDGKGTMVEQGGRIAFGHRRLAIIDLSDAGAQPMTSASGRYTVTYNGEIYGFAQLRDVLEERGHSFVGHSDTEVMLAAFDEWGVAAALERVGGMFAFAVLDRKERRLILARDRIGKKPLFFGVSGATVAFGSELKALRAHPSFAEAQVESCSVALFLKYGYVPGPHTIYRGVFKLPAGHLMSLSIDDRPGSAGELLSSAMPYWSLDEVIRRRAGSDVADEAEALDTLERAILRATEERLVADVPVGVLLSGGIDSSLIAAMVQELSPGTAKSFTIRFEDEATNEADVAADIARRLATDHTEMTATAEDAFDILGRLPEIYDDPLSDPSQVPMLLVSQLTRSEVTVALSGDGGDETFGGYRRYFQMDEMQSVAPLMPKAARELVRATPAPVLDPAIGALKALMRSKRLGELSADRLKKLAEVLDHESPMARYLAFVSQWGAADGLAGLKQGSDPLAALAGDAVSDDLREQMMRFDSLTYLPDDILVKVDRASMAFGLEMRAPLLDYRVIEAAWCGPMALRMSGSEGKVALRRLLAKRLPTEVFDRPKKGFGIPINDWLRGPLKDRANQLLSAERLGGIDGVDPKVVARYWNEHQSGRRNWGARLWTVLVYAQWHERWAPANA